LNRSACFCYYRLFFVVTGFSVNIGGLSATNWAQLSLVVVVAISGKFIGAYIGARCSHLPQRHSLVIAVLLNTRGLIELVVPSIGKELGVLDGEMFSMMVLMALITTAMAGPLMEIIYPAGQILCDTETSSCRRVTGPSYVSSPAAPIVTAAQPDRSGHRRHGGDCR
jgi:predicted Kef-type K+ transport protein